MGVSLRALAALLIVLIVVVSVGQLTSVPSGSVMHQLGAKTVRTSTGGRVPAVMGTPAVSPHVALAVGRVDLLEATVLLPGFARALFVPPRA
jgi:hypothetical protein